MCRRCWSCSHAIQYELPVWPVQHLPEPLQEHAQILREACGEERACAFTFTASFSFFSTSSFSSNALAFATRHATRASSPSAKSKLCQWVWRASTWSSTIRNRGLPGVGMVGPEPVDAGPWFIGGAANTAASRAAAGDCVAGGAAGPARLSAAGAAAAMKGFMLSAMTYDAPPITTHDGHCEKPSVWFHLSCTSSIARTCSEASSFMRKHVAGARRITQPL
jgi:hypothetical protein